MTSGRRRRDTKETLDLALGFLGAFALAFLAITFVIELHKPEQALPYALSTLILVMAEVGIVVFRRRVLARQDPTDEG